jgi:ceramide glucosyltransferase
MADVVILSGGLAALLFSMHLASIALAARFVLPASRSPIRRRGGVSLVRPVCGIDFDGERLLRASFVQDIEAFEVIFCAASERDPVVPPDERVSLCKVVFAHRRDEPQRQSKAQ